MVTSTKTPSNARSAWMLSHLSLSRGPEEVCADQAAHLSLGCAAARGYGSAEQCERKVVGFIESPIPRASR
jgi:hypothetical protein